MRNKVNTKTKEKYNTLLGMIAEREPYKPTKTDEKYIYVETRYYNDTIYTYYSVRMTVNGKMKRFGCFNNIYEAKVQRNRMFNLYIQPILDRAKAEGDLVCLNP